VAPAVQDGIESLPRSGRLLKQREPHMKHIDEHRKWLPVVCISGAVLAGCNSPTSTVDTRSPDALWQQSVNMSTPFGGYDFTSESPVFGDVEVSKVDAEESAVSVADPDSARSDSTFVLRVLWGQLRGDPSITTRTDWTGSVSVSGGRLAVLRRIGFEPGDHLVFPRPDRQTVGFVSHTGPYADGLVLLVHPAPGGSGTFSFDTAAYTHTWSLDSLRTGNVVVQVDSTGNAVSITSAPSSPLGCPAGFLRGHWVQRTGPTVPQGVQGYFRGLWISNDGRHVGHLRGHFGVDASGASVWFGKIIGRDGRLIGLAHGTWAANGDATHPAGRFEGQWFAAHNLLGGTLGGHYVLGRQGVRGEAGFFDGSWKSTCTP
jgi:hypothetical protein